MTVTIAAGLAAVSAVALLATPGPISLAGFTLAARPIGALLTTLLLAGLIWTLRAARQGREAFWLPEPAILVPLVTLASLDWLVTGTVLYDLLPPGLGGGWAPFLRVYLLAQAAAIVSHVPGGIGIFEAALLALLARGVAGSTLAALAASMVMYGSCTTSSRSRPH